MVQVAESQEEARTAASQPRVAREGAGVTVVC